MRIGTPASKNGLPTNQAFFPFRGRQMVNHPAPTPNKAIPMSKSRNVASS
jgi:hypothetical protein